MRRFFVSPDQINNGQALLTGPLAHRLGRVLRLAPGDRVVLLDGSGVEHETELVSFSSEVITGNVIQVREAVAEPRLSITLYQGLLKGDSFDLVLEKCTEVGVSAFVPTITERCVAVAAPDNSESKRARWERVVCEAAEQSGRGNLPAVGAPVAFRAAVESARRYDLAILLWEAEDSLGIDSALRAMAGGADGHRAASVALYVGPEGGFSPGEATMARANGIVIASMGSRVLRAETAGLVAASVVLFAAGEMAPRLATG